MKPMFFLASSWRAWPPPPYMDLCGGHHDHHDTYKRATCTCDFSLRMSDIVLLSTMNGPRMNLKVLWLKDQR